MYQLLGPDLSALAEDLFLIAGVFIADASAAKAAVHQVKVPGRHRGSWSEVKPGL